MPLSPKPRLYALRWIYAACLACLLFFLPFSARWEGVLRHNSNAWAVETQRSPLWQAPPPPSYSEFSRVFEGVPAFPAQDAAGLSTRSILRRDWVAADLFFYFGVVSLLVGLTYVMMRKGERDLILHCALWIGGGTVVTTALLFAFPMLTGRLLPVALVGGLGLIASVATALAVIRDQPPPTRDVDIFESAHRRRIVRGLISVSLPVCLIFTWCYGVDRSLDYLAAAFGAIAGSLMVSVVGFMAIDLLRTGYMGQFEVDENDPAVQRLLKRHRRRGWIRLASAVAAFVLCGVLGSLSTAREGGVYYVIIPLLLFGLYQVAIAYGQILFGRGELANIHQCPHCGASILDPAMKGLVVACPSCSRPIQM